MLAAWLALIAMAAPAIAENPKGEIGYVEDLHRGSGAIILKRGQKTLAVSMCMPIMDGDIIVIPDQDATVTLRLVGHDTPVIRSKANNNLLIHGSMPTHSFWSASLSWAASAIRIFDSNQRESVALQIRGAGFLAVPMFRQEQVVATGQRQISIAWLPRSTDAEIAIVRADDGHSIAAGTGVGGVWTSPTIDLLPGRYVVTVDHANQTVEGSIRAVRAGAMPALPRDLARSEIPQPLRRAATAAWLAAQDDGRYLLESLQLVVADAGQFRPAAVLVDAFAAGQTPARPGQ
jgi:hypothetical protein